MSTKFYDPRTQRLELERQRLLLINSESEFVRVEGIDVVPGEPPERYKVSFFCRGIAAIDASQAPVFSETHEVEIYCHSDFPAEVPWLHWNSPIWHPNIEHAEPKNVCVNKAAWRAGMGLDDLCRQMFDMVQYKNYHATHSPPYPLDPLAAKWVLEYAEPRGIVDKSRRVYVDDRPFYKPTVRERVGKIQIQTLSEPAPLLSRVRIRSMDEGPAQARPSRVVVIKTALPSRRCGNCGTAFIGESDFCFTCGVAGASPQK